jgi:hypothetical protein
MTRPKGKGRMNKFQIHTMGVNIVEALHPEFTRAPKGARGYDFTEGTCQIMVRARYLEPKRSYDDVQPGVNRLISIILHQEGGYTIDADTPTKPAFDAGPIGKTQAYVLRRWMWTEWKGKKEGRPA